MKFILDEFDASVLYTFQSVCIYKAFQAVISSQATKVDCVHQLLGVSQVASPSASLVRIFQVQAPVVILIAGVVTVPVNVGEAKSAFVSISSYTAFLLGAFVVSQFHPAQ
jgi:hypothetical protein